MRPFPSRPPDPAHTFDTFVVRPSSRLAFEAAIAVAENRADARKPLFLRGKTGSGKTHLLNAIHNGVRAREPEAAILHMSAEAFTLQLFEAIRADAMAIRAILAGFEGQQTDAMEELRGSIAPFDVILLDDFRLTTKPATCQEVFRCMPPDARVVFASDTELSDSPFVLRRPDSRTRLAIARRAAALYDVELPDAALKSIAQRNRRSPRGIQSAIALMAMEMRIATPAPAPSPHQSHPPRTL